MRDGGLGLVVPVGVQVPFDLNEMLETDPRRGRGDLTVEWSALTFSMIGSSRGNAIYSLAGRASGEMGAGDGGSELNTNWVGKGDDDDGDGIDIVPTVSRL